jgi:hypothetical protein
LIEGLLGQVFGRKGNGAHQRLSLSREGRFLRVLLRGVVVGVGLGRGDRA